MPRTHSKLVQGPVALAKRDILEAALVTNRRYLPHFLQQAMSRILTFITGLAPSSTRGVAPVPGSEVRAFALMTAAIAFGLAGVLGGAATGHTVTAGLAGLLLVHGMRQFSSVVGHHMTHGAQVIPGPLWLRRFVYDVMSALLLLPRFEVYRRNHQQHHAYVAGPGDSDQRFIAWLGARFDGLWRFVFTMLEPRFHLRFLWARLGAVLADGPAWRRGLALGFWASVAAFAGPAALIAWLVSGVVSYQVATLVQWSSEHLWGKRPVAAGSTPAEIAVAVTYGRYLLPDPWAEPRLLLLLRLAGYALFRFVGVTGDLTSHTVHHIGARGAWTEHAYVATRLLLEGRVPLRQTVTLRVMFQVAFDSAKGTRHPLPPRDLGGDRMLSM